MTQSAISHQIKTLEDYLGQPLFIRVRRKVTLSDAGRDLLATTDDCLDRLDTGFKRLEQYRKPNQLIVHASAAFASRWLLSRLDEFRRDHPEADVWLYTTEDKPDLDLSEVHLAIVYGSGLWPELSKTRLLEDLLVPLCSPQHPILTHPTVTPELLATQGLLHGELRENWATWFSRHGLPEINPTSGPNFSSPALLLQAAEQNQGIALGSLVLAADALQAGRLVCPLPLAIESSQDYFAVTRLTGLQSPLLQRFSDWLYQTADEFAQQRLATLRAAYEVR